MKFFSLTKASDISQNEIIFLSDVSGDDRIFSVKDLPPFALGEILSKRKKNGGLRLSIKADSGVYEVSASPWHKFAVYSPNAILARNLSVGDKVLLRGENALPEPFSAAAPRMSCISEVLEVSKNRKSILEVTFRLSQPLSTKLFFASVQLPFGSRPKETIRMRFASDSWVEIPPGGYA